MVSDLESRIASTRNTAAERSAAQRRRQDLVDAAVLNDKPAPTSNDTDNKGPNTRSQRAAAQRLPSKRDLAEQMEGETDDLSDEEGRMDVDEGIDIGGHGGGHAMRGGGSSRGSKRTRGRGSK